MAKSGRGNGHSFEMILLLNFKSQRIESLFVDDCDCR